MADYPIAVRFKGPDGKWSARVLADTPEQVNSYVQQWNEQGHTEIDAEDATGQPVDPKALK